MKQAKRLLAVTILVISPLLIMTGSAEANPYAFSVDRFELVGNLPGQFVDEFDDGVLGPAWFVFRPTVTESGSVVTLSSPGGAFTAQVGGLLVSGEETIINSSDTLRVEDGAGDFTGTSTWLPVLPGLSQMFGIAVRHDLGPGVDEGVSINVANLEPAVAAALGLPTGGMVILFGRVIDDLGVFDFQALPINPTDLTGDIVLQLAFDDASNQFSGAFSLDGGVTFQSPFTPVSPSAGSAVYGWGLDARSLKAGELAPVDIRPQSCPNPLNVKSKGGLPVAILGTADFDVTQVDPGSIQLEGVSPLRWSVKDVATPFNGLMSFDAFDCTTLGSDSFLDLTLKFKAQEIVDALGAVSDKDVVVLTLTGTLFDGTPVTGQDVVVIKQKGN